MFHVKVYISIKKTVADPQGKTIQHALHSLGYTGAENVRVGKYITLKLKAKSKAEAQREVAEMCQKLLSNPIIEEYTFDIEEV